MVKTSPITRAVVFETPPWAMYKGMSFSVCPINFASSDVVLKTISMPLVERHIASYQDMSNRFGIKIAAQSRRLLIVCCTSKG
jgi:hypothetical protein